MWFILVLFQEDMASSQVLSHTDHSGDFTGARSEFGQRKT